MTDNGCTCGDVMSLGRMPPGWRCISCRAREEARADGRACSRCHVGLFDEEGDVCTSCHHEGR